ncbi:MAG: hypothetical protein JWR33_752 [Naasia sp.]|uniref:alpha/beta hydrolase n=1 Tax=Naasia sp. TaxID=2546198 RepID=UPI0026212F04|nr:alpha/beta hydrolase-fold protein [Naasia sp.]MCU1570011.1 hypothetical protein [Naasia sp.]
MQAIGSISVLDGPVFLACFLVLAALLVLLATPGPGVRRPSQRHLATVAVGAVVGGAVGAILTWLLSDVLNVFGLSLTWVVRWADTVAFAAWGMALVNLVRTRWWRKMVAVATAALTLFCLGLVFNLDFGKFPTFGDAIGLSYTDAARLPPRAAQLPALADWQPPAQIPATGRVGHLPIPAPVSGFPAREAYVYLPPAALVADPPALPVVVVLGGQPGEPADLFRAGRLDVLLDRIAAAHSGVAPIVVVPDQLADPSANPMCVDGPAGASETYLTVDVPAWIRAHLGVTADRTGWTIAGFSQGGTCAIQLGAGHPELFGSVIDVSGEEAPSLGGRTVTIDQGFGGDEAAYLAATPAGLLAAHAPYPDSWALFAAGEADSAYSASMRAVAARAASAGMRVEIDVSPGTGHDWNTARYGLQSGFTRLLQRWGIPG